MTSAWQRSVGSRWLLYQTSSWGPWSLALTLNWDYRLIGYSYRHSTRVDHAGNPQPLVMPLTLARFWMSLPNAVALDWVLLNPGPTATAQEFLQAVWQSTQPGRPITQPEPHPR